MAGEYLKKFEVSKANSLLRGNTPPIFGADIGANVWERSVIG
jgi:hypothetical protein